MTLHLLPDPEAAPLTWLHLYNGTLLLERECKHHIQVANEAGKDEAAAALENALESIQTAKGAVR